MKTRTWPSSTRKRTWSTRTRTKTRT